MGKTMYRVSYKKWSDETGRIETVNAFFEERAEAKFFVRAMKKEYSNEVTLYISTWEVSAEC